jgi:O-antigen/teichoic acid export membrane protein/cyclophilin family peptidyl-prolyl cis-trans isomerase/glycosyltransferase involved in cell wall biosynthesis
MSPTDHPFQDRRLPSATAWRFVYLLAQGGLSLTLFVVLAHVLPAHAFAATAVAQGALVIAQAVGDFGLSQAAVTALPARMAADPERTRELLRGAAMSYATAAVGALVVTMLAALVVPAAARPAILLIAPAGAATVLVSGADGVLRAQGEFKRPPLLVTMSRLGAFAGVVAAVATGSAAATCAAISAGTVIASLPAVMVLYHCYRAGDRGRAADLRRAAIPLGAAELCMIATGRLDTILLSAIAGTLAGATFEATWRIFQLTQYVVGGLVTAAAPFVANAYGAGRHDDALALIRRVGLVVMVAGCALGAGLLVAAGPISSGLFGARFGPLVAHALRPFAIVTPLAFAGFFSMVVLAASPADRWWILPANALGAVVNVVLVLVLAPSRGVGGATLAASIGLGTAALCLVARLAVFVRRLREAPSAGAAGAAGGLGEGRAPPASGGGGRLRVLVLSGRYPEASGRGDQIRALQSASYLAARHTVTVIATEPPSTPEADRVLGELAEVEVVEAGLARRATSALWALAAGRPAQSGWMMPGPTWRAAKRRARTADVVLVITARSVHGRLAAPIVLDHIDALSHNMATRSRGPESLPIRLFARLEAMRMAAWERRLAGIVGAQIGASSDVASLLPSEPPVHVIPISWDGEVFAEPAGHRRDIDVIFTGNMDYPPNQEGADWLQREILPLVRARRPHTSGWIVGRAASRVGGAGVEIAADVPDMLSFLRRARVAVAPVFGAGSPLKTLEAAASGAAVVSTPWGLDCYRLPGTTATNTDGFVDGILALLDDEDGRRRQVSEMQQALAALAPERLGGRLESILMAAAHAGAGGRAAGASGAGAGPNAAGASGAGADPNAAAGRPTGARADRRRLPLPPLATALSLAICAASMAIVLAHSTAIARPPGCRRVHAPKHRPHRLPRPTTTLDPASRYVLDLQTSCGQIAIKLDVRGSPAVAASVAYLVEHGYYNRFPFDRVAHGAIEQVGVPNGQYHPVSPGYTIFARPPRGTRYTFGTVAMFNAGWQKPGTTGSEFFIVIAPDMGYSNRYAILGRVTGSLRAIQAISRVPVASPPDGAPLVPIVIERATILRDGRPLNWHAHNIEIAPHHHPPG